MARGGARPGGGRPKGSVREDTAQLRERAKALGCHPFDLMCHFAMGNWQALGYEKETIETLTEKGVRITPVISPQMRLQAAEKAAEYIHMKLKSVELSGQVDSPADQELLEEVRLLREMLAGSKDD